MVENFFVWELNCGQFMGGPLFCGSKDLKPRGLRNLTYTLALIGYRSRTKYLCGLCGVNDQTPCVNRVCKPKFGVEPQGRTQTTDMRI